MLIRRVTERVPVSALDFEERGTMARKLSRRSFVGKAALAAAFATGSARARSQGASDKLLLGFIGIANRGTQLLRSFLKDPRIEVAAFCDVDKRMIDKAQKLLKSPVPAYTDFRKLLEVKEIDAVVIATPDHWHALQTIYACQAGKDVYVEKPLSITIVEGRRMVQAARKYKRVVQVGTHRRSSETYHRFVRYVREGNLGKVTVSRAYRLSNMWPTGIGKVKPSKPPRELDWDMWLGPRPFRPYQENIHPYKFRWWKSYSSQVANWGVHYFDAIRWIIDEDAPKKVAALGGVYAVSDDRTIPDTLEVTFEMPKGSLIVFGQYEANMTQARYKGCDVEIRGTIGTAFVTHKGYTVVPEKGGQFVDPAPRMKPVRYSSKEGDPTDRHVRNFVDCVFSRKKPNADVEIGHRSTTFSLLANIALETGAVLTWDPENEKILDPKRANEYLHYEYRAPWKLPEL